MTRAAYAPARDCLAEPVEPIEPGVFIPLTEAERKAARLGKARHQAAHAITPTDHRIPTTQEV